MSGPSDRAGAHDRGTAGLTARRREAVYTHGCAPGTERLPRWLRRPVPRPGAFGRVDGVLAELRLNTVCRSAKCPNRGECYARGTATFLIMGSTCTRSCAFCGVHSGVPAALDDDEPVRVAEAARRLGLEHVVITSVTRDDLPDGGAAHFAATVRAVRERLPGATIEVLTSDLGGDMDALATILESGPDVFNHNVETVPRLYAAVRPQAVYGRSLEVLRHAAARLPAKSGLMLGLGERIEEVVAVMQDLREAGVSALTIGQYLRPGPQCAPVAAFVPPARFDELARIARRLGFTSIASAPYVRSSYRAAEMRAAAAY